MNVNFEPVIRNTVRAVIIREQHILLLRKSSETRGEHFALPGGKQDAGETLHQALYRECLEEIDAEVEVLELIYVVDYFKQRSSQMGITRHQVEFLFSCTVADSYMPHNGSQPDRRQLEVSWVGLDNLKLIPLLPKSIATWIADSDQADRTYMGLIN